MTKSEQFNEIVRGLSLPDYVTCVDHEFRTDVGGEPAVRIWVVVEDDAIEKPAFQDDSERVRATIANGLTAAGIEEWPYFSFRGQSEHEAIVSGSY